METALKYGNALLATNDLDGVALAVSGQSRWVKAIRLDAAALENHRITGINMSGGISGW